MTYELHNAECLEFMRGLPSNHVDAIVTDPPYELGFMGNSWDRSGIANNVEMWAEALRILKPGGHLLAFSGSRTYHRMTCAIEDAGFEVRDQIMWVYGSGFPKSHDVSKAIDKAAGADREVVGRSENGIAGGSGKHAGQDSAYGFAGEYNITAPATDAAKQWQGWGTALKPAHEPICVARKPLQSTVANNVLTWGTGAINVDGCRVGTTDNLNGGGYSGGTPKTMFSGLGRLQPDQYVQPNGRWPANFIHDGSDEVVGGFPQEGRSTKAAGSGHTGRKGGARVFKGWEEWADEFKNIDSFNDSGSAARFFYCAKASKRDRDEGCEGMAQKRGTVGNKWTDQDYRKGHKEPNVSRTNHHPTVKPTDLMRYLCRLVTPPGGLVFDPFTGSGSTGKAAVLEGFRFLGCDMTPEYVDIARARIEHAINSKPNTLF